MQIDFHHAVTYVCCRLAGMPDDDAKIVAHAAQYVDDATNDGPLQFDTGQRYVRVTSAHKTLDLTKNSDTADNRLVWAPFHFLPGNDTPAPSATPKGAFIQRMACRPDSDIAREMVRDCIEKQQLPFGLHRFGIALHTYVDTWAHQGFVGMVCDFNKIASVTIRPDDAYKGTATYKSLSSGATQLQAHIANFLSVGHAGVLTFPDLPFAHWSFRRENGEDVSRDNPRDFLSAATRMFNMARRFIAGNFALTEKELPPADKAAMNSILRTTLDIDGEKRHLKWLEQIRAGRFSFGPAEVDYIELGPGSWKHIAVGADPDTEDNDQVFSYSPNFLTSHWKRFHDAVQYHRLFILHELLPRHGISAS